MNHQTTYTKDPRDGWTGITRTVVDETPEGERALIVTTRRSDTGVITTARSRLEKPDGTTLWVVGRDYWHSIADRKVPCTQAAVIEQHRSALACLPELQDRCREYYDKIAL